MSKHKTKLNKNPSYFTPDFWLEFTEGQKEDLEKDLIHYREEIEKRGYISLDY